MAKLWERLGFFPIAIEEARGFAGGIWVLTKDKSIQRSILDSYHQAVMVSFGHNNMEWVYTAVYASPISNVHMSLWDHLHRLCNYLDKS